MLDTSKRYRWSTTVQHTWSFMNNCCVVCGKSAAAMANGEDNRCLAEIAPKPVETPKRNRR